MTKEVLYPIWIQRNAKATSKSFLRGGTPMRPTKIPRGNRGSQENEGRTSVQ